MATFSEENVMTLPASGDLSSDQYKFVDINSSGQAVVVSSAGAEAVGVLENDPAASGEEATVRIDGIAKVEAGGTVSPGDKVAAAADGQAVQATAASVDTTTSGSSEDVAGDFVLGIALNTSDTSAGEIFKMKLQPMGLV